MEPWAKNGDFIIIDRLSYLFFKPRVGHVVVLRHPKKHNLLIIKRIVKKEGDRYWVKGDSSLKSTDSRHFGWVGKEYIVGKVIIRTENSHDSKMSVGTPTLLPKSGGGVIHRTGSFALGILV